MGTILGKKLQTRSESRETVFNRQRNGRLDKRMVSSLGFGNEQVFFTKEVDKYKKANLHISIDASGSMGGSKWNKAITTAVALAKAVDMIPNLEIQISLRSTSKNNLPYIVMVYDSRVDKFSKVKSVFPYLYSSGTTPEGLTFEAIHKEMVPQSSDVDSYFLNFSDGEPYYVMSAYGYYSGSPAANHTYKQIKRMKQSGISVLSYFISEHRNDSNRIFSESYKDSASFVDVSNMNSVVKTMNNLFMKKDG
jgi:nitric oxide reductase activation protein